PPPARPPLLRVGRGVSPGAALATASDEQREVSASARAATAVEQEQRRGAGWPRRTRCLARSKVGRLREGGMAQFSETVIIRRPPEDVWRVIGQPERWFEGYLETRSRSPGYPAPDSRNDHLYRTRMKEEVEVRVTRAEAPTLLEETQQGRTFVRRLRYRLSATPDGTSLGVEDNIVFKGLGKLAAPIASRDVSKRWAT